METLEFVKRAEGGKIIIDVPSNLNGKELRIKVSEEEGHFKKFHEMTGEEKQKTLLQFKGTAKYPNQDLSQYDVYDQ